MTDRMEMVVDSVWHRRVHDLMAELDAGAIFRPSLPYCFGGCRVSCLCPIRHGSRSRVYTGRWIDWWILDAGARWCVRTGRSSSGSTGGGPGRRRWRRNPRSSPAPLPARCHTSGSRPASPAISGTGNTGLAGPFHHVAISPPHTRYPYTRSTTATRLLQEAGVVATRPGSASIHILEPSKTPAITTTRQRARKGKTHDHEPHPGPARR